MFPNKDYCRAPQSITFGFSNEDSIRKVSVVQVTQSVSFDNKTEEPIKDGLYDPRMGPIDSAGGKCVTCKLPAKFCTGHYGHIELPVPVFHPFMQREVVKLLRLTCPTCKSCLLNETTKAVLLGQMELLEHGLFIEAQQISSMDTSCADEDDRGTSRKNKGHHGTNENVIGKIREAVDNFKRAAGIGANTRARVTSRHVEDARLELLRQLNRKVNHKTKCESADCEAKKKATETLPVCWKVMMKDSTVVYSYTRKPTEQVTFKNVVGGWPLTGDQVHSAIAEEEDAEHDDDDGDETGADGVDNDDADEEMPEVSGKRKRAAPRRAAGLNRAKKARLEHGEASCEDEDSDQSDEAPGKGVGGNRGTNAASAQKPAFRRLALTAILKRKKGRNGLNQKDAPYYELDPASVRERLRCFWQKECQLLSYLYPSLRTLNREHPTDAFFVTVVPVTPIRYRPVNKVAKSILENLRSVALANVITAVTQYSTNAANAGTNPTKQREVRRAWLLLQKQVNLFAGSDSPKQKTSMKGFKQLMDQKQGLVRSNMLGKRVDYSARTVITPDPNIGIGEIGVPQIIAERLAYPVLVNEYNCHQVQDLIRNGTNYPGAKDITVNNTTQKLVNKRSNESIACNLLSPPIARSIGEQHQAAVQLVVRRQMMDGDLVVLNRQPTLHKPSVMVHRVKILKGEKTFRLHYANCKAYNADFDGDEMNIHFPQSEAARSEAYHLVGAAHQYLVPKDGTPLGGLIQDHLIAGLRLTLRGRFFEKKEYHQLVYAAVGNQNRRMILLPPSIVKPRQLWSGKQVVSTIIMNLTPEGKPLINMNSKSKVDDKEWRTCEPRPWIAGGSPIDGKDDDVACQMSESQVIFRNGELLSGVLDKKHCGPESHSLVHLFFELYGGQHSSQLLSSLSRLFTAFLQMHAFTVGIGDVLVLPQAEAFRKTMVQNAMTIGDLMAAAAVGVIDPDQEMRAVDLDKMKSHLLPADCAASEKWKFNKATGEIADNLVKDCSLLHLVVHKGAPINMQEVRNRLAEAHHGDDAGKKADIETVYKSVGSQFTEAINTGVVSGLEMEFLRNGLLVMINTGSKGGKVNLVQMTGCLGQVELEGKRPNLMISGRSLPSYRPYCTSLPARGFVFNSFRTGLTPQELFFHCMAGREGLIDTAIKTSSSGYLQRSLVKHMEGVVSVYDGTVRDSDGLILQFLYGEDGLDVCKSQYLTEQGLPSLVLNRQCINTDVKFDPKDMNAYVQSIADAEMYDKVVAKKGLHMDKSTFEHLVYCKSVQAACEPGEPVGMLAAQSIGEPSTQMTLNTFHHAGRGDMNVTLGIPRLKEILMSGGSGKTPNMAIPMRTTGPEGLYNAKKLAKFLTRTTLADVLQEIDGRVQQNFKDDIHTLQFTFKPVQIYGQDFNISHKQVISFFEQTFIEKCLFPAIDIEVEKKDEKLLDFHNPPPRTVRRPKIADENCGQERVIKDSDTDDSDMEVVDDEDADTAKKRVQKRTNHNYDQDEQDSEEREAEEQLLNRDDDDADMEEDEVDAENNSDDDAPLHNLITNDAKARRDYVMKLDEQRIVDYAFQEPSSEAESLRCTLTLKLAKVDLRAVVEKAAKIAVISSIPNIKRALVDNDYKRETDPAIISAVPSKYRVDDADTPRQDEDIYIRTEGVNIRAMYRHADMLDVDRLYSNDVGAIAEVYGIEAASKVIEQELAIVFEKYGIRIDRHHLSLIANYQVVSGAYKAFSRHSMKNCTSPFLQMSNETATEVIMTAMINGRTDFLTSPTSRIIVGIPGLEGTGCCDAIYPMQSLN